MTTYGLWANGTVAFNEGQTILGFEKASINSV